MSVGLKPISSRPHLTRKNARQIYFNLFRMHVDSNKVNKYPAQPGLEVIRVIALSKLIKLGECDGYF